MNRLLMLLIAAAFSFAAAAQEDAAEEAPPPPPGPEQAAQGEQSIRAAYQREFALLTAQKRDLETRLANQRTRGDQARSQARAELDRVEGQVVAQTNEINRLEDAVFESEQAALDNEDAAQLLEATFQQAGATLEELEFDGLDALNEEGVDDNTRVDRLFSAGLDVLGRLSSVRREQGEFYLTDGTEVTGTIVRMGNVAAYGISDQGAGALAPAGGGRLKVWNEDTADAARAVASGNASGSVPVFLYETLRNAIEERDDKTILSVINSGGTIGWIIVGLGLLGLVLIVMRAIFLRNAGSSTDKIIEEAGGLVRQGRMDEALQVCKRVGGAPSRVVAAAIRNLDRDREHLEDIVSEAILHENAHLNRFGAFILVIAAVAPLLGLLGTVTGMISTFDVITEFGTGDPKLLSGGIAIALVTTELGLIVAIPTLLLGNVLSGWADRIKDDMEKAALKITNIHLASRANPVPPSAPPNVDSSSVQAA